MKVLAINGSPRKNGNTAQLLQEVLAPLQTAGWETELVQLGGKKIQGCRGCGKCAELKNGRCVFDNDLLNELLEKMLAADAMILGTPCYFTAMTAELKALANEFAPHNVLVNAGGLWNRIFTAVAAEYPDVTTDYLHVDATMIMLVQDPQRFDVIVTDNLFGDIITDLAAAVTGGIGLAASANINPTGAFPSMFEPVHGSAPDIAGQGIADPTATISSMALLLRSWALPLSNTFSPTAPAKLSASKCTTCAVLPVLVSVCPRLFTSSFKSMRLSSSTAWACTGVVKLGACA